MNNNSFKKKSSKVDPKLILVEDLINKMFEIAGHNVTYKDIEGRKDEWYREWTMTEQQEQEWIKWGENKINEVYKYGEKFSKREMGFFNLMYGLKVLRNEEHGSTN